MAPASEQVERDPRPMPAEFQYLLIVVALFALLLLAGLPGQELERAGESTARVPDRAWATRWTAQVQAEQARQAAQRDQAATTEPTPQR